MEAWRHVQYYFLPNRSAPCECHFVFKNPATNQDYVVVARLPVTDSEALDFVDNQQPFALSPTRVDHINQSCLTNFDEPFVSYAYHTKNNQVLVVSKITAKEIEVSRASCL